MANAVSSGSAVSVRGARPSFERPAPAASRSTLPSARGHDDAASSRHQTTIVLRRGAYAPEKSSLGVFVLLGLLVGGFAAMMMYFCLPDANEQMHERQQLAAMRAAATIDQLFPPPPVAMAAMPELAPEVAPPTITVSTDDFAPAPATADVRLSATKGHTRRARPKRAQIAQR